MRRSGGNGALLSAKDACTSAAHLTASTTPAKLDQQTVAHRLDDAAMMLGDFRIDYIGTDRP
jgi:hypothetical protein